MADDTKAKEILKELPQRKPLGERLLERVGARKDDAPGAARRRRLFARLGLPDPYDPKAKDTGTGLGPVSLKLSERRRPAPHARVKDPSSRQATSSPGSFKPKGIPSAPTKPPPKSAAEVAKDYAKRQASKPKAEGEDVDPLIQRRLEAQRQAQEALQARREAEAQAKAEGGRGSRGRFRMRRTEATGPKSRPIEKPPEKPAEKKAEEPSPPPPRRAPPGPPGGLDDLFGFADEGRVRLPPRKKKD